MLRNTVGAMPPLRGDADCEQLGPACPRNVGMAPKLFSPSRTPRYWPEMELLRETGHMVHEPGTSFPKEAFRDDQSGGRSRCSRV
jgi:hypothetical protein